MPGGGVPYPIYFEAADHRRILREYPLGKGFVTGIARLSRDELHALQDRRFLNVMKRGWEIPFYHRRWRAAGIEPGDIRSLEDLGQLPTFSKADLMASIEAHPPFGDYHGMDSFRPENRTPVVMATTSGTTGRPQPLFFGPRSREIHNLLLARVYLMQGLRPHDVVHSVYGHGLINGGHYLRETFLHFTNAIFLSAGTGAETRSRRQVELMRDFGVTVLVGFVDYVRYLAKIARDMDIIPGRDIPMRMVVAHLGFEKREAISDAWGGAKVYDWYGVADTGTMAGEGPDQAGFYVLEDAHVLEIIDGETGQPVPDGDQGDICVTTLFKDDFHPVIRFNTHDVSAFETSASPLGWTLRRLRGILGRSDNMIKLRGINVFPTAIGALLRDVSEATGEYLCRVDRKCGRDELTVLAEVRGNPSAYPAVSAQLAEQFRTRLGVALTVELVAPGGLAESTGLESRQKAVRLIDNRYG